MDRLSANAPSEPRAPHTRWRALVLVFAGGALGTLLREIVGLGVAPIGGFPLATFVVNVVGAFALGVLLARLAAQPAGRWNRLLRLFFATGVLGGFTTYSGLANDAVLLIAGDAAWLAIAYALLTVLIGTCSAWAGMTVGGSKRSGGAL